MYSSGLKIEISMLSIVLYIPIFPAIKSKIQVIFSVCWGECLFVVLYNIINSYPSLSLSGLDRGRSCEDLQLNWERVLAIKVRNLMWTLDRGGGSYFKLGGEKLGLSHIT